MKLATLSGLLLLAAVCGTRLLAQDGSPAPAAANTAGGCQNASGACSAGSCNSGSCHDGYCQQCAGNACATCGRTEGACDHCGCVGPLRGVCRHCKNGIHCLCHHPPHHGNRAALYRASQTPWHGGYYYTQWGAPVALVIPPTAEMHTDYSWGVPSMRVSRNDHQFQRGFPGAAASYGPGGGYGFLPTPYYPSDTNQFGVYYVRGPW